MPRKDLCPLLDESYELTEEGEAFFYEHLDGDDQDAYLGAWDAVEEEDRRREQEELRRMTDRPRILPTRFATFMAPQVRSRAREGQARRRTRSSSSARSPDREADLPSRPAEAGGVSGTRQKSAENALRDRLEIDAARLRRRGLGAAQRRVRRSAGEGQDLDSALYADALLDRIERLARDLGYLRRRFASNEAAWTGEYLADRLAGHVQSLDAMLHASAGELVRQGVDVEQALALVDRRGAEIRWLLGDRGAS